MSHFKLCNEFRLFSVCFLRYQNVVVFWFFFWKLKGWMDLLHTQWDNLNFFEIFYRFYFLNDENEDLGWSCFVVNFVKWLRDWSLHVFFCCDMFIFSWINPSCADQNYRLPPLPACTTTFSLPEHPITTKDHSTHWLSRIYPRHKLLKSLSVATTPSKNDYRNHRNLILIQNMTWPHASYWPKFMFASFCTHDFNSSFCAASLQLCIWLPY